MKIKMRPRKPKAKYKLGRKSKIVLKVAKPSAVKAWSLKCRKCGEEAVSYYRHALWFYPDDYQGKQELWGYCNKHRDVVFNSCPNDVKMSFTKSGRSEVTHDFDNRIIVGDLDVKPIGKTAYHLLHMKGWPSVRDKNYDTMLSRDYEQLFLIYDGMTGAFKRSLKEFGKAVKSVDYGRKEVLVYYGKLEDKEESKALAIR
jgi:hypothetical protein